MMKRYSRMSKRKNTLTLIPLILLIIINLVPFYIMLVGAFKPSMALYNIPADISPISNLSLRNIFNVVQKINMPNAFKNSLLISGGICLITVFVGMSGGYVFAKHSFWGKKFWFALLIATMMLPKQILLIPNFIVANELHIVNTRIGVILTTVNSAYAIFLCKQYMVSLPNDMIEAAILDGCTEYSVFFRIVLPTSKPVIGALTIFTFISSWNDFVWQNIMLTSKKVQTVPLALAYLDGQTDIMTTLGNKMAGATLSAIPMVLIFICFQRFFIKGIAVGGLKE